MKICLTLLIFIISLAVRSQSNYMIIYKELTNVDTAGKGFYSEIKGALYIQGDSITTYRLAWHEKELYKKMDLSKRQAHHATIMPLRQNFYYNVIHNGGIDCYIKEPKDTAGWLILKDTLTMLNIKCIAAQKGEDVAWFAPSIPISSGPLQYYGLPGLVLAVYNARFALVLQAEKIIYSIPEIVATKGMDVLTTDKFRTVLQEKNRLNKKKVRFFGKIIKLRFIQCFLF